MEYIEYRGQNASTQLAVWRNGGSTPAEKVVRN